MKPLLSPPELTALERRLDALEARLPASGFDPGQIADEITDALFVTGLGHSAARLSQRDAVERDLGGWCRESVRALIFSRLNPHPTA